MDSGCLRQQTKRDCDHWLQKKGLQSKPRLADGMGESVGDWMTGLGWGWLEWHGTQVGAAEEAFASSSACLLRTWQHLNEESRKYWAGSKVM